ncbi:MAG: prepilin peptidase [Deltaproteobacteria bacterium]|nr:prepilin peptidase [Deltaproteobacteria bacterium]
MLTQGAPGTAVAVVIFFAGASVASFATLAAYRLPRGLSVVRPGSLCPLCGKPLGLWAKIPVVSYLALRGRCAMCGGPIGVRHLVAELGLGAAAVYLFWAFPASSALARFVLVSALLVCSLVDYDWRLIPNAVTMPGMVVGVAAGSWMMPEVGWKESLIGLGVGAGVLYLTGEAYRLVRRREGVGLGDVFLTGMAGAFLGWRGAFFTLVAGSLLGTLFGLIFAFARAPQPGSEETAETAVPASGSSTPSAASILGTELPFGPFLSLAAGWYALFGPLMGAKGLWQ